MGQININIRIDSELKKEFEKTCNDLGLTMTTAFNVFAKAVVKQRGLPFPITLNVIGDVSENESGESETGKEN